MNAKILFGTVITFLLFLSACSSEESKYKEAKQAGNIQAYEEYIQKYPAGKYSDTVKVILDSLRYQQIASTDSVELYKEFLKEYPESKFASIANEKLNFLLLPSQIFQNNYRVRITKIQKVTSWHPFDPNPPFFLSILDKTIIILIGFEVENMQSGEIDTDRSFENFELEDIDSNKYKSIVLQTDIREMGFNVPIGTNVKYFRISGLTFDIENIAKNIK